VDNEFSKILEGSSGVIGRRRELEMIVSILLSGKHILLEGAPGTSKSTLLKYVTTSLELPLFHVEGSADLTPSKLIGIFNPSLALNQGFKPEFFEKGPLFLEMEEGGVLYIDEFNRASPDATNTLIRAMEENDIVIPRFGTIKAKKNFRVVAAMNPFDDTGVSRLSRALFDRFCRIKMDYQPTDEEREIVLATLDDVPSPLVEIGVKIGRATRFDDRLRQGSSVRGAVDFVKIAENLASILGEFTTNVIIESANAAFSGKIWIENPVNTAEEILLEIVEAVLKTIDSNLLDELSNTLKKKTMKS